MITDDFFNKRMLRYCSDDEVFRAIDKYIVQKTKEAKEQGDTARETAYQKVHIFFLDRHGKMLKEMKALKSRFERQKRR